MIGRWFGKSKKRIGAEEFGQVLAGVAQGCDTPITSEQEEFAAEFSPLGSSLVSASAVIWSSAKNRFLERLPAERFSTLRDTYYEKVWEGIVSRFGARKAQYDEFVWHLGGFVIPDEIKTDWALRSGVHDVLGVAVTHIGPAADEFLAESSSAAATALGKAVGRILFGGRTDVNAARAIFAYTRFMAVAKATAEFLHELEGDGVQVF